MGGGQGKGRQRRHCHVAADLVLGGSGCTRLGTDGGPRGAQQVTIASPYRNIGSNFFERNAIGWSGNWRGFNFSYGGAALATPPFGGFDANAGITNNFALTGKHGQINFNTAFGQGSKAYATSQTPSVTLMNGQQGYFSDTSQTPFVISMVPVVGAFPIMPNFGITPPSMFSLADPDSPRGINPRIHAMAMERARQDRAVEAPPDGMSVVEAPALQPPAQGVPGMAVPKKAAAQAAKLMNVRDPPPADPAFQAAARLAAAQESSAGRAAPSVEEARRMHELEKGAGDRDIAAILERARAAEEDGKPGVAKIYYQMVARRGTGDLKQQALERLDALNGTANP